MSRPNKLMKRALAMPVPKPNSVNDVLPPLSPQELIDVGQLADLFLFNAHNGGYQKVSDLNTHPQICSLRPPFPALPLGIARTMCWVNVDSEHIPGPQTFQRTETHKAGITKSQSNSFGSEIGASFTVAGAGLSEKLSATLNSTVTVTDEHDVTKEYTVNVPANQTVVWTLWQLVEIYTVFLIPPGPPISSPPLPFSWSGATFSPQGQQLTFPLTLQIPYITNPQETFFPDAVPFNT